MIALFQTKEFDQFHDSFLTFFFSENHRCFNYTASLSKDLALGDKEHTDFVIKNVLSLFLLFTLLSH